MFTHTSVRFRGHEFPSQSTVVDDQNRFELDESGRGFLLCRTCGLPIARVRDRIEVGGKHGHSLFNPSGILFEVGCFAVAPGCRFEGEFTLEFTWFADYAWRFAMCLKCRSHLGWEYRGASGGFVGLITTELREFWS